MHQAVQDSFQDYLGKERRYSPHTLKSYATDVAQFFRHLEDRYPGLLPEEVRSLHIKAWIYELSGEGCSPRSINRKRTAIHSLYKYLQREGRVRVNPCTGVQSVKTDKPLVKWVPEKDMDFLLDRLDFGEGFAGSRDAVVLELLYGTGIRLSELIGLSEASLSLSEGTIKVLGKRSKERIVPLPAAARKALRKYLAEKKQAGYTEKTLLLTDSGKAIYPVFVQRLVKRYIGMVSTLPKRNPHLLRHSYATALLNRGADLNAIKELLGHSSLAATQVYTHNSIERLKTIYKQSHPKG